MSPKANENWERFCSACFLQESLPTLEKLDSGSSSPSGSSHPYLLSSKEQIVWGCLVVSASSLSPVVPHYSSPGLEKGRIYLYSSDAGTDWSPCSQSSMSCPWIFISHEAAPAQRPETSAPAEPCHRSEHQEMLLFMELGSCSPFLQQDTWAHPLLLQQQPWHPCQMTWLLLPAHTEVIQTSVRNAAVSWSI